MPDTEAFADTMALGLARECLYRFLAAAVIDPNRETYRLLLDPENQGVAREAADLLRAETTQTAVTLGFGELPLEHLDLGPLLEELCRPPDELSAEYDRVFGLVLSRECPPYETEYHPSSEATFRAQQLADIAGFYRAFGLNTSSTEPERPDHLALELEFMALLLLKKRLALASMPACPNAAENVTMCDDVQQLFFRDHLAWWVPSFATGLQRKAQTGFYADVGKVLAALLPMERGRLDVRAPRMPLQPVSIEPLEDEARCAVCSSSG